MVFSIYLAGILLSVLTGLLMKATLFRGPSSHFIMELPPYHAPRLRHILIHTWIRLRAFVQRAGIVIVGFVIVLGFANSFGYDGGGWSMGHADSGTSILARAGKAVSPAFAPMGIRRENWPAAVGLFTGLFAKEAVVGTLNAIYSQGAGNGEGNGGAAPDFVGGVLEALRSVPRNLAGVVDGLLDPLGLSVLAADEKALAGDMELDERTFFLIRENFTPAGVCISAFRLDLLPLYRCACDGDARDRSGTRNAPCRVPYGSRLVRGDDRLPGRRRGLRGLDARRGRRAGCHDRGLGIHGGSSSPQGRGVVTRAKTVPAGGEVGLRAVADALARLGGATVDQLAAELGLPYRERLALEAALEFWVDRREAVLVEPTRGARGCGCGGCALRPIAGQEAIRVFRWIGRPLTLTPHPRFNTSPEALPSSAGRRSPRTACRTPDGTDGLSSSCRWMNC